MEGEKVTTATTMGDLKTLLRQQIDAFRVVERALENFKKIGKTNLTAATIRNRMLKLSESFAECKLINKELAAVATDADRSKLDYFINDRYLELNEIYVRTSDFMADALSKWELTSQEPPVAATAITPATPASHLDDAGNRLPTMNLPSFSGAISEWETFRDRFQAIIIQRRGLSNVSKFQYLLSCVNGEASDLITNIAITDAGFTVAWGLLVEQYENKRLLVATHLQTLHDLPQVCSEDAALLRRLRDKANIAIKALTKLERPVDAWDDWFVFFVTNKLDSESRKAWELHLGNDTQCPKFSDLDTFLQARVRALGIIAPSTSETISRTPESATAKSSRVRATCLHNTAISKSVCDLCKENHTLGKCSAFKSKSATQRFDFVKGTNRCINCLSPHHSFKNCSSSYNCHICNKRHHTLLHFENSTAPSHRHASATDTAPVTVPVDNHVTALIASCSVPRITASQQVLLATAWIELQSPSGRSEKVRALLDQGSVVSIISENLTQRLRLPRSRVAVSITGIGNNAIACHSTTTCTVASCHTDAVYSITAYVLRSLSNYLPSRVITAHPLSHIRDLTLADENPFSNDPIELIIGADHYGLLLLDGLRKGTDNEPTAQNTTLGWILSGPVPLATGPATFGNFHCNVSENLDTELRRFWEVEELPSVTRLSPAELKCEEHFQRTHARTSTGQYIVRLPFIEGPPIHIGPSLPAVMNMFKRQENRLQRTTEHFAEYSKFLSEYETLGHMVEIKDQPAPSNQTVYIPHHAVIREHSATTRLRVVFNASAKTGNGTSLNDHLLIGPKLQTDLAAVILRWRRYRYVFIADIAKMYRQILIDPRDVDYQRILWRNSPSVPFQHFRLLTVTYGTAPAPYLALHVLQQLARDEGSKYPLALSVLRDQIYVDDCVFGADDPNRARQTRDQVTALLKAGGFTLRKWASNDSALIEDIDPTDHGLAVSKPLSPDDNLKVLGIIWNPETDSFRFEVQITHDLPTTKREVLSTIARFYDPLGWAAPVVIVAKIMMQRLWLKNCVRVTRAERAFLHCGVDYAGPIPVRTTSGRGHKSTKAYIALFVCMTTRAVHIELVGSYTTAAFMACYDRFSSRRGLPVAMYSDNGTTFQGADREVTAAFRAATRDPTVRNMLASDQVAWHFIPPSAPHFGGLWEAGIRSLKYHLKRVIGATTLTFEELTTVLSQIEACMNSRPIAPSSDNLDDYTALTPGHFLIGTAITTVPSASLLDVHDSRLTRWQLLRKLYESVWKAWSTDYLHSLQQRPKWHTANRLATYSNSRLTVVPHKSLHNSASRQRYSTL
ncbi:uncharacterized protein LOC143219323 [Lasioglossum baleicum]|uniref:uncharacterized protein LOC143219323 n=1 Tax=Lasioglossum baleicum TaxID=434251 RepID=UPI003FCC93BF